MKIIKKIEKEDRGIYTGAIGYISPAGNSLFNVAIRTLFLNDKKGEIGIGGGIVYDSTDESEYDEAILKAKFLTGKKRDFSLIESILWTSEKGFYLLDLHLKRLKSSAEYFGIKPDLIKIKEKLNLHITPFNKKLYKLRLVVNFDGNFKISSEIITPVNGPVRITISGHKTEADDTFLYFKTTNRTLYDEERKKAVKKGFFEVLFMNKKGEITEGSISNIFIQKNNIIYTPSARCGLLEGILRNKLIREKKAFEKVLFLKDLREAEKIFIGNSVRGLLEGKII